MKLWVSFFILFFFLVLVFKEGTNKMKLLTLATERHRESKLLHNQRLARTKFQGQSSKQPLILVLIIICSTLLTAKHLKPDSSTIKEPEYLNLPSRGCFSIPHSKC